jgi:hypothetical protein
MSNREILKSLSLMYSKLIKNVCTVLLVFNWIQGYDTSKIISIKFTDLNKVYILYIALIFVW